MAFKALLTKTIVEPLDSRKTRLLKTKTVDFPINNKQFSSHYFKKQYHLLLKNSINHIIIQVKY